MHKGTLLEKRVHFLRREEREGEDAQIPRDFLSLEKESSDKSGLAHIPRRG
jgi:hypothetical protein